MTLRFSAAGVPIRFDAPRRFEDLFAAAMADLVHPVAVAGIAPVPHATGVAVRVSRTGRRHWRIAVDDVPTIGRATTSDALHECLIAINAHVTAMRGVDDVVLHAATFRREPGDGSTQAVAVCGDSGAGKSTLTAAAVLAGHGFVADEVCSIDPETLTVVPYHRPIGVRAEGAALLGITPLGTGDGGDDGESAPWRVGSHGTLVGPSPLGLIVLLDRQSHVFRPVDEPPHEPLADGVERLSPAHALVSLVRLAMPAVDRERETFRRLERLVHRVPVVSVRYRDCRDAVRMITDFDAR